METNKTSYVYQKLNFLYQMLTSVLPSVTSPVASCYFLKSVLTETIYVNDIIGTLQKQWREALPFEEDDSPSLKWTHWANLLNSKKITNQKSSYPPLGFDTMPVSEEDENIMRISGYMFDELLKELDKLYRALYILDSIVKASEPDSIHKLYNDLKNRCEDAREYNDDKHDLSKMSLYELNDYKNQLKLIVFEKVIKENSETKKQQKWKEITNDGEVPDELKAGRYIYKRRFDLKPYDLIEYFEYERVARYMDQSYNKVLNENLTPGNITDIINKGVDKDKLKKVIQNKFIPKFQIKNRWICAWRVLKDTHILIDAASIGDFIELMTFWFPKKISKDDLKYYKDTYLAKTPRKKWIEEDYIEDIKTHPKACPKAYRNFNALCLELENILKENELGIF